MSLEKCSVSRTTILSEPPTRDQRLVYALQVILLYILILVCVLNLSIPYIRFEKLEYLWIGLLSSSIGYLLPNPSLKNRITTVS